MELVKEPVTKEKIKTYRVTVHKVEFPTDGKGFVKPVARLVKTFAHKVVTEKGNTNVEFDALTLDSVSTVFNNKVRKGSKLQISVADNGAVTIHKFIPSKSKDTRILMPVVCFSCGHKLKAFNDKDLVCDNIFCTALDLGGVYKLFSLVMEDIDYALVSKYLCTFPTKDGGVRIGNLMEYLYMFTSVGPKNTATRENMFNMVTIFTDKEKYSLTRLERKLEERLSTKQSNSFYWSCINMPNFALSELEKLNPSNVTAKSAASFKSKRQVATITHGRKCITVIMNLFKGLLK